MSFERTKRLFILAVVAAVLIGTKSTEAGKPPQPPTGLRYRLYWVAGQEADTTMIWSKPKAVNEHGDVVGQAAWRVVAPDPDPDQSGENWEVFLYTASDGKTQNLNDIAGSALPYGWRLIDAGDINNSGQIVGGAECRVEEESNGQIVVYQNWGVFRFTPAALPGHDPIVEIWENDQNVEWSSATSINDTGDMLAHQGYGIGLHPTVCWVEGGCTEIPAPEGGNGVWQANALNNFGLIAGSGWIGNYVNALRYVPNGNRTVSLGWLKSPGTDRLARAYDINDLGQATGSSRTSGGSAFHAFRYTDGVGMKDLGALGTSNTIGYGINRFGDVVGDATDAKHAFLYTDTHGMVDLNAAIVNFNEWPSGFAQMRLQAWKITGDGSSNTLFHRCILGSLSGNVGQACLLVRSP